MMAENTKEALKALDRLYNHALTSISPLDRALLKAIHYDFNTVQNVLGDQDDLLIAYLKGFEDGNDLREEPVSLAEKYMDKHR